MKTVMVVLILHMVITQAELNSDYAFGDIISFPRTFGKVSKSYKHFAVYVGQKAKLFGQAEKDIFHRIRKPIDGNYCLFGSLKNEAKHQKENYLDKKLKKPSDDDIYNRIKAMTEHCGTYKLLTNNCEHLATYVRYGRAYLNQPGTRVSFVCKIFPDKSCPEADKEVQKLESDQEFQNILKELDANSQIEDQDQDGAAG